MVQSLPEVWLRGPVPDVPPLLQPAAHTLLQALDEIEKITADFPDELLWQRPAGMASPGFHLLHIAGVIDRLFTYARGLKLSDEQLNYLAQEKEKSEVGVKELFKQLSTQVNIALKQLQITDENTLTNVRLVGRRELPSTVIGLLFHAAEHTMRHTGQLLVSVNVLKAENKR